MCSSSLHHPKDEVLPCKANNQCHIRSKSAKDINDVTKFTEFKAYQMALLLSQYDVKFFPQKVNKK